jgi:hypothetical protein
MEAELDYPIIFAAEGCVIDGVHRIAKAYALGLTELKAVRFPVMPEPDERRPRATVPASATRAASAAPAAARGNSKARRTRAVRICVAAGGPAGALVPDETMLAEQVLVFTM